MVILTMTIMMVIILIIILPLKIKLNPWHDSTGEARTVELVAASG